MLKWNTTERERENLTATGHLMKVEYLIELKPHIFFFFFFSQVFTDIHMAVKASFLV